MRVTCIQLAIGDESPAQRLKRVLDYLDQCRGSDLVLLPEIWPVGYFQFDRYEAESQPLDGPLVQALLEKARELRTFLFTGSFVERDGADLFNTSLLLDPDGRILTRYRKIHLFGYQSAERQLLKPGTDLAVAPTPWGKVGLSTCYDLRFPELYRRLVGQDVQMFLVAAAWPAARVEAWTLFNRARAHENLAFLFACNCAGPVYGGHSLIVDPRGQVVAEAQDAETLLSAEVDPGLVEQVRREFPALQDRVLV